MRFNKGFTLIELLVVISIIGLLSSVVLASLNTARAKGRDSQRIQNLKQLQNAVEIYRLQNGEYPKPPNGGWYGHNIIAGSCAVVPTAGAWLNERTDWIPGLVPTYISSLPVDPKQNGCSLYVYASDGKSYKIMAHALVEGGSVAQGKPFSRMAPNCVFQTSPPHWWVTANYTQTTYAVYGGDSPGYECS